ncbi:MULTISPECIES: substrate-binding domain-containing protein [unclassified Oceanobacter]|uniref:molybdate ABC transporter substrate-binding protein n=1 Tax=unclassified Oceanobacter TaxID=2620260 RepID=UPI0026E22ED3|nr:MULTISPECIES: substrate-binding domain-containing protein [unclassified Oceanobacter]MDO6681510.1 substrate-binding domain-containing protein [Oceanobacter sp. 5_MG-2023]MDP2548680.1 substrate-binding domain-containing protein [Oceanobacter sp. 4_MG-2023]
MKKQVLPMFSTLAMAITFSASAQAVTVNIAAAKLFEDALWDTAYDVEGPVIQAFKTSTAYTSLGYSVDFTVARGPAGTYASTIANNLDNDVVLYELFISADTDYPDDLYDNYYALGHTSDVEVVSQGKLMHWSNGNVDVASNWPTDFIANYTSPGIGICNPTNGPYGQAALDVIAADYSPISSSDTTQYGMIKAVDSAVASGSMESGFVPTALNCSSGAVSVPSGATYHVFDDTYDHGAIQIYSGDGDVDDAAEAFMDWLASSAGQAELEDYCLAF